MPRWLLPAVVVGDVVVIGVLYAVIGWPALIVATPLVICSIVVIVVLSVNGSGGPAPLIARAFVNAAGQPRGPAGGPTGSRGHDDDWYFRTHQAGHPHSSSDDGWTTHHGGSHSNWHDPHHWSDNGSSGCSDSGSSWSDSGSSSSSSDSCSSSSDSGSSSSDSGSSSSSSD